MDTNYVLLMSAVLNAYTAWQVYQNNKITKKIEAQTDGLTTALVAKTDEAAHARGKEETRVAGEAKAADVAKGVAQGRAAQKSEERK